MFLSYSLQTYPVLKSEHLHFFFFFFSLLPQCLLANNFAQKLKLLGFFDTNHVFSTNSSF